MFSDQFAFHLTGSTSAAIISILHTLSTCSNSILLSLSSHWTFPRRSTPSDTPSCMLSIPSWLNSTCRRLSTTGWWNFSAATRTIPCLVETSRAREASRPASYRARALDQPPTLSQQLISDRSTMHDNVFINFTDDSYLVICRQHQYKAR